MSEARPQVDVGVVTYNTRELTVRALRHLLDSDQGCDLRVLVRDNASADGTAQAVAALVPEAELDAGDANLGFAGGMNSLLSRSDRPWFFALNSDAWPEPGAIRRLVDAAAVRPKAAAVVPRLLRLDGSLEHSTHPFPSLRVAFTMATGAAGLVGAARAERMGLEGAWRHDHPRAVDWAVGAAMLLPRQAIERVGGFDERFFMYAEDLEWCWRAHQHGFEIWFDPVAVVRHVGNASGGSAYGRRRTAAYMHNTYRFYRSEHGAVRAGIYRGLNLLGAARQLTIAILARDPGRARYWREQLAASLPRPGRSDHPEEVRT